MIARVIDRATCSRLMAAILLVALVAPTLRGQVSPEEHAKHHPQGGAPQQPGGTPSAPPGGMAGMMEGMGAPPKELYPRLMELPSLTPEQSDEMQRAAHERMESGTKMMAEAMDILLTRAGVNDYAAMQDAMNRLREGAARFDSGLSTHRAIAEGRSPQDVGLQWFKGQMNLAEPPVTGRHGWLDWSVEHWIVMIGLAAFAVVMVGMYFVKMRRATALLRRLTEPPPGSALAATPAAATAAAQQTAAPRVPPESTPPPPSSEGADGAIGPWSGSLRVSNVFAETPSIKTFRLVNPSGGSIPFAFVPGQFLTLAVALAGKTTKRAYTIASSAAQRDYVEVTIKREELGVVSRYLHDRVAPGDLLQIAAPQGRFTFSGTDADSIVLIGAGVGITPLMCIVRTLTDRGWNKDIFLLFACRTSGDFVFREELEHLQRRHPNLHVVATMTRAEGTVWMGPKGRLTKELIAQSVPDISTRRVHICGPAPMMDATRAVLLELGVPSNQIRTEAFGPSERKDTRQSAVQTAMVEASPETTPVVSFAISGKAAPLPADTTVLEAAEHVGVSIDNSCRAGTCGQCKVRLLKGSVTMAVEDALAPEEKGRGIILACQAKATRNIEVEA